MGLNNKPSTSCHCPLLLANGARVWCPGRVPKHRNHWQEVEGSGKMQRACYLAPKTLNWCIFWAFIPRLWFPYSSFQQVRQPSITCPVEEDTSKIVWRSIMFNGSFLRVCSILWIVKKIRFSLHESGRTKPWCPGLVPWPSAKA